MAAIGSRRDARTAAAIDAWSCRCAGFSHIGEAARRHAGHLHPGPLAALRRGSESQKSSCAIVMSSAAATFLRIDLHSFSRFSCFA